MGSWQVSKRFSKMQTRDHVGKSRPVDGTCFVVVRKKALKYTSKGYWTLPTESVYGRIRLMQLPLTRGWQKFVWELKLRVLFFLRNVLVLPLIFSCISVPYERFCIDPLTVYLRYPLDYPELDNIPFDSNFKFLKNKEALTVQHTGRGYSVEGVVV